jgi:hypothetical protein
MRAAVLGALLGAVLRWVDRLSDAAAAVCRREAQSEWIKCSLERVVHVSSRAQQQQGCLLGEGRGADIRLCASC